MDSLTWLKLTYTPSLSSLVQLLTGMLAFGNKARLLDQTGLSNIPPAELDFLGEGRNSEYS